MKAFFVIVAMMIGLGQAHAQLDRTACLSSLPPAILIHPPSTLQKSAKVCSWNV